MQQILVGYDGSEASAHALDQAINWAKAVGASLTILTAADDRLVRGDGTVTMAADEELAQWTAAQGADRARAAGLKQVQTRIAVEAPADALVHTVQQGAYDLLVVGHRGVGALEELFLGSTAKSVVDRVKCSVLVVR
jgi:nucleotide-binding universal stress UspA family protein